MDQQHPCLPRAALAVAKPVGKTSRFLSVPFLGCTGFLDILVHFLRLCGRADGCSGACAASGASWNPNPKARGKRRGGIRYCTLAFRV